MISSSIGQQFLPQELTQRLPEALAHCVSLAQELGTHAEANAAFEQLQSEVAQSNPLMAEMMASLWQEVIAGRRSAAFWQQLCDVERSFTESLSANHVQLQQNYLRLMQEQ